MIFKYLLSLFLILSTNYTYSAQTNDKEYNDKESKEHLDKKFIIFDSNDHPNHQEAYLYKYDYDDFCKRYELLKTLFDLDKEIFSQEDFNRVYLKFEEVEILKTKFDFVDKCLKKEEDGLLVLWYLDLSLDNTLKDILEICFDDEGNLLDFDPLLKLHNGFIQIEKTIEPAKPVERSMCIIC